MEFTELTLKIIFVFIPGIVCCIITESLIETHGIPNFRFIIYSFILGCMSYAFLRLVYLIINFFGNMSLNITFIGSIGSNTSNTNYVEVIFASVIAILLALLLSKILSKAWLHSVARKLGISSTSGYSDVWLSIMQNDSTQWILIRDKDKDLMYEGYLHEYSRSIEMPELFLTEVIVYKNSTAEELYKVDGIYIIYQSESMQIEFRETHKERRE